jgi:predicted phage baseplate assembly protein
MRVVFDPERSAIAAFQRDLQAVQPVITLQEVSSLGFPSGLPNESADPALRWFPQRDLLNSDRFAREFAVEVEEDGRAYLRFGDDVLGKRPPADAILQANYRVGNGRTGNIGADAIAHLHSPIQDLQPWFTPSSPSSPPSPPPIRNPIPARGGTDPEPISQVRLYAPQAFRTQQRAVTEADYAEITQRFPGVRRALATRRWTGSWYTIFITVDRSGGLALDPDFKQQLTQFLGRYRLTGHDLELESPQLVPLSISLKISVAANYFRSQVKAALQTAFSNQVLPDGRLAFFHPDNFTFGQPVYLSQVVAAALQVAGVQSVEATEFQRRGSFSSASLEAGQICFGRLEIALLNNDPTAPEAGEIKFEMEGGR